jgi:TolA-binding protein
MRTKTLKLAAMLVVLGGMPALSAAAPKDQPTVEARVDKLEHEMRAVQRKVFPGGDGRYFPPEITPPNQPSATPPGTPASSPVADLDGRVNALESQMSALTGQVETATHRVQVLEEAFNAYKRTTDARLKALEDGASATGGTATTAPAATSGPAAEPSRPQPAPVTKPATPPPAAAKPAPAPAAAKPDPARAAAVAAIEKPVTTDPADDIYVYGYRLWNAKFYPEAETQLKLVVSKYPQHRRASWAQNLLGRTYLDQGRYKEAAQAFYDNYKANPQGERTPDSVYYLATALAKLNRPTQDVCKAYSVLTETYGPKLTPAMTADVAKQRATLKCP